MTTASTAQDTAGADARDVVIGPFSAPGHHLHSELPPASDGRGRLALPAVGPGCTCPEAHSDQV